MYRKKSVMILIMIIGIVGLLVAGVQYWRLQTHSSTDSTTRISSQETPMNNLQTQLEAVYNKLRVALESDDFNATLPLMELPPDSPAPTASQTSQFSKTAPILLKEFPELSQTRFIKVDQKGEWAGYYDQTDLTDPDFINISMVKFHYVNGSWKISSTGSFGSSFPKNGSDNIEAELATNSGFQL